MYQKEMRFKHQLKSELVALKQRIHSGKQEQKKQRQLDLERYTVLLPSPALPRSHATHTHTHTPTSCQAAATVSERQVRAGGATKPGAHSCRKVLSKLCPS